MARRADFSSREHIQHVRHSSTSVLAALGLIPVKSARPARIPTCRWLVRGSATLEVARVVTYARATRIDAASEDDPPHHPNRVRAEPDRLDCGMLAVRRRRWRRAAQHLRAARDRGTRDHRARGWI